MQDYINIGCVPADEPCAQLGSPGYYERAKLECSLLKEVMIREAGMPPLGARLAIKGHPHDFGTYYELVCIYNDELPRAREYAFYCESNLPMEWPADVKKLMDEGKSLGECIAYMKNNGSKYGTKTYGLAELAEAWGMGLDEMAQECMFDGICPAICVECGLTTEMEPDQDQGWCSACEKNTVKSALILAGMI
jgi:hypothetical protein